MIRFFSIFLALVAMCAQAGMGEGQPSLSDARKKQLVAAYDALKAHGDIEKRRLAALPEHVKLYSIDVSDKLRSASFGHTTAIVVAVPETKPPTDPNRVGVFYVQYGRSTNTSAALFGPFNVSDRLNLPR